MKFQIIWLLKFRKKKLCDCRCYWSQEIIISKLFVFPFYFELKEYYEHKEKGFSPANLGPSLMG